MPDFRPHHLNPFTRIPKGRKRRKNCGDLDLPREFDFPNRTPRIPIDPKNRKFENETDWFNWMIRTFLQFLLLKLGLLPLAKFRYHTESDPFVYPMTGRTTPIRFAMFSDFGTGLYHSRYIARQMTLWPEPFDYAVHAGDVYYAGTEKEFRKNMAEPLGELRKTAKLFIGNANHEMFSGAKPYFRFIDEDTHSDQTASYYCIRSDEFQVIGIDTAYFEDGRYNNPKLKKWLGERLEEGRTQGLVNILVSANEPYSYLNGKVKNLYSLDLVEFDAAGLIDLWFWGNEHYNALYRPNNRFHFYGCCIGHGGFPYETIDFDDVAGDRRKHLIFIETFSRFHGSNVRLDAGNNGFVEMLLHKGGRVELNFYDWRRFLRHRTVLVKNSGGPGLIEEAAG